jgi:hypothetical protein
MWLEWQLQKFTGALVTRQMLMSRRTMIIDHIGIPGMKMLARGNLHIDGNAFCT